MLVTWKFKVCKLFAIHNGEVVTGKFLNGYRGGRAKPEGMYIYKPSQSKYDYVDYTDKSGRVDASELTCVLEFLGYIKFVEQQDERET